MTNPPTLWTVHIQPQGDTADAWSDQTLLDALESGQLQWPSSCRNGSCRTCLGRITQGRVRYEIEWPGLSTEEIDEGYVLPCVAHPLEDVHLQDPLA